MLIITFVNLCEFGCWLVLLRIYVALAVFQPYRNLEAGVWKYNSIHLCPFDYTAFAVRGKVWIP